MNSKQIRARVAEFAKTRSEPGDDTSAQVEAALFTEEVFGIALGDDDMTSDKLGTYRAMERFLLGRMTIRSHIAELAQTRPEPGDDTAAQVEAALFLEEVFGITLRDDDMTDEKLGSYQAMERLVLERIDVN